MELTAPLNEHTSPHHNSHYHVHSSSPSNNRLFSVSPVGHYNHSNNGSQQFPANGSQRSAASADNNGNNSKRIMSVLSETEPAVSSQVPSPVPTYMFERNPSVGFVRMTSISNNKDNNHMHPFVPGGHHPAPSHSNSSDHLNNSLTASKTQAAMRLLTVKQIRGSCDDVVGILDSLIKYDSADAGAQSLLVCSSARDLRRLIRSTVKPFFVQVCLVVSHSVGVCI
jgi:hypothetical protein